MWRIITDRTWLVKKNDSFFFLSFSLSSLQIRMHEWMIASSREVLHCAVVKRQAVYFSDIYFFCQRFLYVKCMHLYYINNNNNWMRKVLIWCDLLLSSEIWMWLICSESSNYGSIRNLLVHMLKKVTNHYSLSFTSPPYEIIINFLVLTLFYIM